jgi:glycosyltransferase involved in cell wall biosynthesis
MLNKDRDEMRVNSLNLASKYDWKNIAKRFKELYEKMRNENESSKTKSL